MAVSIQVSWLSHAYRGSALNVDSFPPSPHRLLAALVAAKAPRDLLERLCARNPVISVPKAFPMPEVKTFVPAHSPADPGTTLPSSEAPSTSVSLFARGGKRARTTSGWYVAGAVTYSWDALELDEVQLDQLRRAAASITVVGTSVDMVACTVLTTASTAVTCDYQLAHAAIPSPGSKVFRGLTPQTLDWMDQAYEAQCNGRALPHDHRTPDVIWQRVQPACGEGVVLPLVRCTRVPVAARLAAQLGGAVATDATARKASGAQGIYFPQGVSDEALAVLGCDHKVQAQFDMSRQLRCTLAATWQVAAQTWRPTTSIELHPDAGVARLQLERLLPGAVISRLQTTAFEDRQLDGPRTDARTTRWFFEAVWDVPIAGPVLAGTVLCYPVDEKV